MIIDDEAVWKALADPVRRALLDLLRLGPKTTGKLAEQFDQTRFGVMKHLEVLESAQLITTERRGREKLNFLNAATLTAATNRWLTPFQKVWSDRLSSLTNFLDEEKDMQNLLAINIQQEVVLGATPEKVFAALTKNIDQWWGERYRQTGPNSTFQLKPELGAELIEINSNGHAVVWGRVEEIRAPHILYFSGRFAVVGAVAGRVHFDLAGENSGKTRLKLLHQAVGDVSEDARNRFALGWADLLGKGLVEFCEGLMP